MARAESHCLDNTEVHGTKIPSVFQDNVAPFEKWKSSDSRWLPFGLNGSSSNGWIPVEFAFVLD